MSDEETKEAKLNAILDSTDNILDATQKHLESVGNFYEALSTILNNLVGAKEDAEEYRNQIDSLRDNIRALKNAYGGEA
jgi:polyhydroxyalkanoate synthesis regulator phasin